MTGERNIARKRVVGGLIAGLACAALPLSASAQTAGNDQIKELQDQIRKNSKRVPVANPRASEAA
jgi:hypothetical protein